MPHLVQVDWDHADRMQSADLGGGGTGVIDQIGASGARTVGDLQRLLPQNAVHTLTGNLKGWISVDPVPGNRHAFGGIRLLLRTSPDGIEFMVRNTH